MGRQQFRLPWSQALGRISAEEHANIFFYTSSRIKDGSLTPHELQDVRPLAQLFDLLDQFSPTKFGAVFYSGARQRSGGGKRPLGLTSRFVRKLLMRHREGTASALRQIPSSMCGKSICLLRCLSLLTVRNCVLAKHSFRARGAVGRRKRWMPSHTSELIKLREHGS